MGNRQRESFSARNLAGSRLRGVLTNYLSRKGREPAENPRAAIVLHWDHMHRQVRVEGRIIKAPDSDSDAYFALRAKKSRVGAWASKQSEPIGSRRHCSTR